MTNSKIEQEIVATLRYIVAWLAPYPPHSGSLCVSDHSAAEIFCQTPARRRHARGRYHSVRPALHPADSTAT